ncbi:hypothetical protein CSV86_007565 [Pseudomonas putida CSV86]|uniref:Uncharacterized protein n=1 Tax=Pseudomonas bharatica CSV86 TaxID=1005395 RepID=L1LT21_9PSED|nr:MULTISPECIES: hypothetical protein [Pseudomonas]MDG9882349.1 hypothetical protein [Pseudomonas sp. GD04058]NNJ15111.1 hypothetical protein [Pseudomonas bharatica CSV86]
MLLINNLQMQQLAQATDEVFLKAVAACVSRHWPQRCERLGPQALLTRLRSVGQVALGYGIKERPDVLRLANMAMALDHDLSRADLDWVHLRLGDTRLRPADRLDLLDGDVREWLLERRARA